MHQLTVYVVVIAVDKFIHSGHQMSHRGHSHWEVTDKDTRITWRTTITTGGTNFIPYLLLLCRFKIRTRKLISSKRIAKWIKLTSLFTRSKSHEVQGD